MPFHTISCKASLRRGTELLENEGPPGSTQSSHFRVLICQIDASAIVASPARVDRSRKGKLHSQTFVKPCFSLEYLLFGCMSYLNRDGSIATIRFSCLPYMTNTVDLVFQCWHNHDDD